ncbi:MAG: hypothetical protein EON47_21685, partial [Acetobacteraceae bacterium]
LGISFVHAFIMDIAIAAFYVTYAFGFNLAYDRVFRKRSFEALGACAADQAVGAVAQCQGMSSSIRLLGQPLTRRVSRSVK